MKTALVVQVFGHKPNIDMYHISGYPRKYAAHNKETSKGNSNFILNVKICCTI